MTKTEYAINFKFTFDAKHRGAPYTLDGRRWLNHGELCEIADKSVKGFGTVKDENLAYDMVSDIPATQTSIKSAKATLCNATLGDDFMEAMSRYFETTVSTNWDYVMIVGEKVIIYNMDKQEFEMFMRRFARFDESRKVIRFRDDSYKMVTWFEANL